MTRFVIPAARAASSTGALPGRLMQMMPARSRLAHPRSVPGPGTPTPTASRDRRSGTSWRLPSDGSEASAQVLHNLARLHAEWEREVDASKKAKQLAGRKSDGLHQHP